MERKEFRRCLTYICMYVCTVSVPVSIPYKYWCSIQYQYQYHITWILIGRHIRVSRYCRNKRFWGIWFGKYQNIEFVTQHNTCTKLTIVCFKYLHKNNTKRMILDLTPNNSVVTYQYPRFQKKKAIKLYHV